MTAPLMLGKGKFLHSGVYWLGFSVARLLTHQLYEMRSPKSHVINAAHEFVTIMGMSLIIGLLGV